MPLGKIAVWIVVLLIGANSTSAETWTVDPAESRFDFTAEATISNVVFPAQPQFPGALSTGLMGEIEIENSFPASWRVEQESFLSLEESPMNAEPGIGGAAGFAPANLAAQAASTTPVDLPPIDGFDLGELRTFSGKAAVRDSEIILPIQEMPTNVASNGDFDAGGWEYTVRSAVDFAGDARTRSPNLFSYLAAIAGAEILAGQENSPIVNVDGNLLNREIDFQFASSELLEEVEQLPAGTTGRVRRTPTQWRIELPLDFEVADEIEEGVLSFRLTASGLLTAVHTAPPAGDVDLDGDVDLGDFDLYKAAFGGDDYVSDFNGDGSVDLGDFNLLKDNFGMNAAVPEPSSGVSLAIVCLAFFTLKGLYGPGALRS